ncbi:MAG: prepilin peptidase [Actinobacteria bacterium]|nr:prepilin peptidase [Actinomycetota bacterium]
MVIVRVPSGESVLRPPSKCPQCEAPISPRDNIPVVSWVLLRGRCRSCGTEIPAGYPLVELSNAVLWVIAGLRFGASWELVPYALLFSVLLALSVIDLELYLLPNRITYPSMIASVVAVVVLSFATTDDPGRHIAQALLSGLGYAGFLTVMLFGFEFVTKKQGMGMGDVKLAVILGIWVGWIEPVLVVYSLIFASVFGLVVGVAVLAVRRESRPYPFGPWLALGAVAAILASDQILEAVGLR